MLYWGLLESRLLNELVDLRKIWLTVDTEGIDTAWTIILTNFPVEQT